MPFSKLDHSWPGKFLVSKPFIRSNLPNLYNKILNVFFTYLDLWNYNETIINELSDEDVLDAVTTSLAKTSE